jgi:hypothetical protein
VGCLKTRIVRAEICIVLINILFKQLRLNDRVGTDYNFIKICFQGCNLKQYFNVQLVILMLFASASAYAGSECVMKSRMDIICT